MVRRVLATAKFLLRSLYREQLTLFFILLSLLSLLLSISLSELNIGEKGRLFRDSLMLLNSTTLHIFGVLITTQFLERERRGFSIFPLTSGLRRGEYIASIYIFQTASITALALLYSLVSTPFFGLYSIEKLYLYTLSTSLLITLYYTVSTYIGSRTKSLLYAIALFFIGNSIDELKLYSRFSENSMEWLTEVLDLLMPRFYLFDGDEPLLATGHYILYTAILVTLTAIKFYRKRLTIEE